MTLAEFIAKWRKVELKERSAAQEHYLDLCRKKPTWLVEAHRTLDAAVTAAYGWPAHITDDRILECLLALNLARPTASAVGPSGG